MNIQTGPLKEVIIYTDGACKGNPGVGGWGAVMLCGAHQKNIFGFSEKTTNNRMELTAVVEALTALKQRCYVTVYSDSRYVIDGVTQWMRNWKSNGWKTSKGELKNVDLWQKIDILNKAHIVEWRWIKGHSGNTFNDLADELANMAIQSKNMVK